MSLSMRKRLVIFLAAVALVHFAFYFIPRYAATRPRFDEAAYNEAVSMLKEEVGAQAVENGTFSIPREGVSLPWRGEATVAYMGDYTDTHNTLLIKKGSAKLVSYYYYHWPRRTWENRDLRVANLTLDEGRNIYSVLFYLYHIAGPDTYVDRVDKSNRRHVRYLTLKLKSHTWFGLKTSMREFVLGEPGNVSQYASGACAARFAVSLHKREGLTWSSRVEDVEPVVVDALNAALPPDCYGDQVWASYCAGFQYPRATFKMLPLVSTRRALPSLRWINRLGAARKAKSWFERLPLIGRYFARQNERFVMFPDTTDAIWLIDTFSGKTEDGRLKAACALAFDPSASTVARGNSRRYLQFYHPTMYNDLYLAHSESMSENDRAVDMAFYEASFGNDDRVARQASGEASAKLRVRGYYNLYLLSGDRRYLNKLYELATPPSAKSGDELHAVIALIEGYRDRIDVGSLMEFLSKHRSAEYDWLTVRIIGDKGGPEDFPFVTSIVADTTDPTLTTLRLPAAESLRRLRDPGAALSLISYMDAAPHQGEAAIRAYVAEALANVASDATFHCLERLREKESRDPYRSVPTSALAGGPNVNGPAGSVDQGMIQDPLALAPVDLLERSLLECRCRMAPSPADFILALGEKESGLIASEAIEILADKYTVGELQSLLADAKYARISGYVCGAMFRRRNILEDREPR